MEVPDASELSVKQRFAVFAKGEPPAKWSEEEELPAIGSSCDAATQPDEYDVSNTYSDLEHDETHGIMTELTTMTSSILLDLWVTYLMR